MTVEQLLLSVRELSRLEQMRLLHELEVLVIGPTTACGPATALRGIGRELRNDTDAQEYVDRERDSWGG